MLATKRAMMISRNLNLLKIHRLGIECQQLIGQQLTHARQKFQRLSRLDCPQHACDRTQDTRLRTGRHLTWRRRCPI